MQPAARHLDRLFVVILAGLHLCFLATTVFSRRRLSDTVVVARQRALLSTGVR